MIGIILTGHGNFASGLYSSVKLIAGEKENFVCCDFEEGSSDDDLLISIEKAIEELKKTCEGVIIFSDLKGGSPFQKAVMAAVGKQNIEVIAGSNLPMILEVTLSRDFIEDINELVEMAINIGKDNIYRFVKEERKEKPEREGGI